MSFSQEWEDIYARGEQMVQWPWTDLVSLVFRFGVTEGTVIELGCGPGANATFFGVMGMDYWGVDGSATAIDVLQDAMPQMRGRVSVSDFTKEPFGENVADLVVDRAAVVHNPLKDISHAISLAWKALKPGGLYIGIDWFSGAHEDRHQFTGVGVTTRMTEPLIKMVFEDFEIVHLEHKIRNRIVPRGFPFGAYDIVARKRGGIS